MHFHFRNVNDAFPTLVRFFADPADLLPEGLADRFVRSGSRNGDVITIEEPVTLTYDRPTERVLFNQARDANPFFHLYEALWMLAGRNDLAPLLWYVSTFGDYSDDGRTLNGAYGYRWRHSKPMKTVREDCPDCGRDWGHGYCGTCQGRQVLNPRDVYVDQLDLIVEHLRRVPDSRRVVLQMWNVEDDLLKIGVAAHYALKPGFDVRPADVLPASKDVCCNTEVFFRLRRGPIGHIEVPLTYLDMTVINRSNDMVWGTFGANVVHFSFLQEYVAARVGVEAGRYHQVTNNLHVYTTKWEPEKYLADGDGNSLYGPASSDLGVTECMTVPLVSDPEAFERELPSVVGNGYAGVGENKGSESLAQEQGRGLAEMWLRRDFSEPFFQHVAKPMILAWAYHKAREYEAAQAVAGDIVAEDWRLAATNWLVKRRRLWEEKQRGETRDIVPG